MLHPSLEDVFVGVTGTGGVTNTFVPIAMATSQVDCASVDWATLTAVVVLIALSSTFLGPFRAASVSEAFEPQDFSNSFRFPMVFLCGLLVPTSQLPALVRPLSYPLPSAYGANLLHAALHRGGHLPPTLATRSQPASTRGDSRPAFATFDGARHPATG